MLVLSRRVNEQIQLNDNVSITVLKVKGNIVRIGIEAPDNVTIHRREIWLAINGEGDDDPGQLEATPAA